MPWKHQRTLRPNPVFETRSWTRRAEEIFRNLPNPTKTLTQSLTAPRRSFRCSTAWRAARWWRTWTSSMTRGRSSHRWLRSTRHASRQTTYAQFFHSDPETPVQANFLTHTLVLRSHKQYPPPPPPPPPNLKIEDRVTEWNPALMCCLNIRC